MLCYPETELLPAAGLEGSRRPPHDGGGGGLTEPRGPGLEVVAVSSTPDWEAVEPELARKTAAERAFYHEGALEATLKRVLGYAADEVAREDLNAEVNWEEFDDAQEKRRRKEALLGAQLLSRSIEEAEANGRFRPDLLADAFGVACWAIGLHPQQEQTASPDQLSLLADLRLRFAIGMAMPIVQTA